MFRSGRRGGLRPTTRLFSSNKSDREGLGGNLGDGSITLFDSWRAGRCTERHRPRVPGPGWRWDRRFRGPFTAANRRRRSLWPSPPDLLVAARAARHGERAGCRGGCPGQRGDQEPGPSRRRYHLPDRPRLDRSLEPVAVGIVSVRGCGPAQGRGGRLAGAGAKPRDRRRADARRRPHRPGLGLFADVDLVIGCLDNREARLWVNRQCWKVGTPWIDAGIQEIQGVVKVFVPPDSACYECAMTERDYQLLNLRYNCPLLKRDEILAGK